MRISSSGICETDVWVYRSGAFARPGMVLGHMAGGEIVDVGVDVDGDVSTALDRTNQEGEEP